jgi:lysozyme
MQLCKKWEGCRLQAYPDPATGGDPWTIGYGATGPDIKKGVVWTQEQADADLQNRLISIIQEFDNFIMDDLTDNEAGAIVSLGYNIGLGNLRRSTLIRDLNNGDTQGAADQFLVWDHAAGHVMSGLYNRRKAEREVFLGGSV